MRDTESSVLTQRTEVANISGSRLAHVPHLSCKLGLAAPPNWRRTGVDLKWAEGELRSLCRLSRWLNAGIRGATANIKTQWKTYPSGVIKEGEIRWAASVCERVCVAELQPPPTLLSNTQILKQCTFLVPAVKRPRMKKRVFFKKKVAVALIPYLFSVLNCTGYIGMQISTNSSSVGGWTDLCQLCETPDTSGQWMGIHTQATPQIYWQNLHWIPPILTFLSVTILTILTFCSGFFCCWDLDAYQNGVVYLPSESRGALWYRDK